jgi:hypothetical protein
MILIVGEDHYSSLTALTALPSLRLKDHVIYVEAPPTDSLKTYHKASNIRKIVESDMPYINIDLRSIEPIYEEQMPLLAVKSILACKSTEACRRTCDMSLIQSCYQLLTDPSGWITTKSSLFRPLMREEDIETYVRLLRPMKSLDLFIDFLGTIIDGQNKRKKISEDELRDVYNQLALILNDTYLYMLYRKNPQKSIAFVGYQHEKHLRRILKEA